MQPINKNSLVSIIMPVYNAEDYLHQAIDSILNQSHQNIELLVADDGSKDNSKQIIDEYLVKDQRVKAFHNAQNMGYLKTCNKLFALCKGEFISFQDADDYSEPNRFELILEAFNKDPELGLLGSNSRYFVHGSNETFKFREAKTKHEELRAILQKSNTFDGATICIRRAVYEDIGGYKTYYDRIGSEDYDWLCRISEKYKIGAIPQPLYHVRMAPNSITRAISSPRQLVSHAIVLFCNEQRQKGEIDSLSPGGNLQLLDEFVQQQLAPYEKDPALVFRRGAEIAMYNKLYRKAFWCSWQAIKKRPLRFINYRTMFYVLRKANLKLLK